MPSALELAGSAHRLTTPAFKLHAMLACLQIALVTWICRAADIWRSKRTSEQFPGHLGPSVFIAAIGVSALTAEWPWRTRAAIEGKLSMWGGGSYVAGEAVNRLLEGVHHQSALKHYLRHGLHAWMSLFVFCLGLAFLQASKLEGAAGMRSSRRTTKYSFLEEAPPPTATPRPDTARVLASSGPPPESSGAATNRERLAALRPVEGAHQLPEGRAVRLLVGSRKIGALGSAP